MSRPDPSPSRRPEDKPSSGSTSHSPSGRDGTSRRGRSGYGSESIRPHLRAQLEQQKLLRPTFPPEDPRERDRSNNADS
jgi:hypothetical protein